MTAPATRPERPGWDHWELLPGLHHLRCGHSNAYLWWPRTPAEGGATLIDTGPVGTFPRLLQTLAELDVTDTALQRVVLTHFHDDHTGAAAEVAEWSGAEVVAGRADADVVRGLTTGPVPVLTAAEQQLFAAVTAAAGAGPVPRPEPCRVDREVEDGDVLDLAGGARVLALPGHTPGSIALHLPRLRAVLTGDTAAEHDGVVVLGPFGLDRAQVRSDLRRLGALDVEVACFGHGEPVLTGAARAVAQAGDPFA
ncbi:MBL fold metallo-hydrolase [Quadrisphaera oryzae]|uniref:MBL fold metallo-hydrolase n=1 Tax=Quadrisphaera TaxID=317661 RepID=UPI001646A9A2|nr:MBL fold metallo-hydrolase [Quadrisphaera sp. RL12-1S]MBC3760946.1 MBL fold metallo-hydrolase [Quadrisphaera sp. RL12-1S]